MGQIKTKSTITDLQSAISKIAINISSLNLKAELANWIKKKDTTNVICNKYILRIKNDKFKVL